MSNKPLIGKKHIILTALFAIYMSEYMICLICMDRNAYDLTGPAEVLHYLKMPAYAAGIILFALGQRLWSGITSRRIFLLTSNVVFIAGMACVTGLFTVPGSALYFVSCAVTLLSLGLLGGAVYYYFAIGFVGHPWLGRMSGIGGAAAFLIQISVQQFVEANAVMLTLLVIGFAFTAYVTIGSKEHFDWMFDEPLEYAGKGDPALPNTKVIITGIAGMMLLYIICGLTDTIIISMNYAGDMAMYAWPRLFGVAGYLIGGILGDICRRKWLMISALCLTILCIPLPFMLKDGSTVAATCLFYVIIVGQIELLNVFFWDLAPKTSYPQLVAGMSRLLSCLCEVIFPLFAGMSVMMDLMIEVFLSAVVILCIALGGYIPSATKKDEKTFDNETASFDDFAARHGLTPRETDFLKLLIESDDDVSVMASDMNISTRTVYRHINSIYEKTGTETRYALMRYYFQEK